MCGQNFIFHGGCHVGTLFLVVMTGSFGQGECIRHCEYPTYYSTPFNSRFLISFGFKLFNK